MHLSIYVRILLTVCYWLDARVVYCNAAVVDVRTTTTSGRRNRSGTTKWAVSAARFVATRRQCLFSRKPYDPVGKAENVWSPRLPSTVVHAAHRDDVVSKSVFSPSEDDEVPPRGARYDPNVVRQSGRRSVSETCWRNVDRIRKTRFLESVRVVFYYCSVPIGISNFQSRFDDN